MKTVLFYVNFIMRGLTPIVSAQRLRSSSSNRSTAEQYPAAIGTLWRQIYILFSFFQLGFVGYRFSLTNIAPQ